MNGYRRLTQVDRIRIKDFLILGLSQTQIADKLKVTLAEKLESKDRIAEQQVTSARKSGQKTDWQLRSIFGVKNVPYR